MERLEWRDSYRVGHAALDEQHQGLLALVNRLIDMGDRADAKAFFVVLNELLQYAEKHFSVEEELMQVHGFAGLAAHVAEHERFVEKVFLLNQRVGSADGTLLASILDFLKSWYIAHVLGTDRDYIPCLKAETSL